MKRRARALLAAVLAAVALTGLTGCKSFHHHGGCWSSGTCYVKPVENP